MNGVARGHNWSDSYTFTARRCVRPNSIDNWRRLVVASTQIRALRPGTAPCDRPRANDRVGRGNRNYSFLALCLDGFGGMMVGPGAFSIVRHVTLDIQAGSGIYTK